MKKRIIGIDLARSLAVIGMIIVNFKVVLGGKGSPQLKALASLFDGKAAALFVVLAGVGLALMTKSALKNKQLVKLSVIKKKIAKRALFLFVVGLSYIYIWPADILHFYGVYMLAILLLLKARQTVLLLSSLAFIFIYPFVLYFIPYETSWNFENLTYFDFWSINGFFRNLFVNGFHPVLPWTSFMLFGYWLGQQDLQNSKFVGRFLFGGGAVFLFIQLIALAGSHIVGLEENGWSTILATSPMPPYPLYMFNGISFAATLISICILIGQRFSTNLIVLLLNKLGQLALSVYVAHIVIGITAVELLWPNSLGTYSIVFSFTYALVFSLLAVAFSFFWLSYFKLGPLEWLMRKVCGH
ncbi:DUF418 domain-containing protein [Saprospira grandis]|uniref:DUF418 domain-containing protein n=1 Tax=Saprospira grandis TaxID=1008 RepID=UPI0022DD073E|nr:DUF418 domain-containing protein [Saprospira grandis]WBM73764.1 DUF418 domain-containing protein [Saprospira grandis]